MQITFPVFTEATEQKSIKQISKLRCGFSPFPFIIKKHLPMKQNINSGLWKASSREVKDGRKGIKILLLPWYRQFFLG